ncbi:MAG: T9SS type A sorting domain-containing protein [Bacteroidota bacterium]
MPAESYTLEISDLNNCLTLAGPYDVQEMGAPEIDDDNIAITPSNFGAGNGSITGIIVTSPYTIAEYIWKDDQSAVVGTDLDLIDVPTGYYDLTVIDENTCESHSGPYFVGEIGGPLTANPSASPEVICKGETAMLSPGAGGGSGDYTYAWTSTPAGFSSTLENPVVEPAVNTTYNVDISDGYILVSGSVDVIVHPLPLPDAGDDQSIPHGTSTILYGSATQGSGEYAYSWTPIDKLIDATVPEPQTKNIFESTPFFLEIEDLQTGCISEAPANMTVNIIGGILNTNPTSFPDSVFCQGETFWLHANAGGGSGLYTYEWTCSVPGLDLPGEASFSLILNEVDTYEFYLKVNDGYNDVFGSVTVVISPAPLLDLGAAVQTYCIYDTVTLNAGNPGSSYLWSNGDTSQMIRIGTTGLGYDEQEFSVNVVNAEGCEADASVTIIFDYEACVGIMEQLIELDARIYPNPTTGKLVVEVSDVEETVKIMVFNVLGNIQYEDEADPGKESFVKQEIDLSSLARGVYIIKLQTNKGLKVSEIILK